MIKKYADMSRFVATHSTINAVQEVRMMHKMCVYATDRQEQMKLETKKDEEVIFHNATSDNLQQWRTFVSITSR